MNSKTALLQEIRSEDFAVYEAALYLNGHPRCREALAYYKLHRDIAAELKAQYEALYGPLTIYGNYDENCWRWVDSPWPWEKEAN